VSEDSDHGTSAGFEGGPLGLGDLFAQLRDLPSVRLAALWAAAAGSILAEHSVAVGRSGSALRVECASEAWLAQVQALEKELLARLQELGLKDLSRLELSLRPRPAPSAPERRVASLPPERIRQIQSVVQGVQSQSLRLVLERLLMTQAQSGGPLPPELEGL